MPIMDDEDAIKSEVHSRLSDVVSAMFRWITDCRYTGRAGQARVGRRFIAFAWVVNPSLFGGPSASALAERLALSPPMFRLLTGEVAKEFGITNAAQRHAWNRGRIAPQRRSGPRGPQGHTQGTKTPYKPSQRQERAKESLSSQPGEGVRSQSHKRVPSDSNPVSHRFSERETPHVPSTRRPQLGQTGLVALAVTDPTRRVSWPQKW